MSELEMYKEIVKAVHNQYITAIVELEDLIHHGYMSGELSLFNDVSTEDVLIITHTTFQIVCNILKDSCDAALEVIESEMEK